MKVNNFIILFKQAIKTDLNTTQQVLLFNQSKNPMNLNNNHNNQKKKTISTITKSKIF